MQSAVRSPQSAVRSPQSAVRSPQSAVRSPQSAVRSPRSLGCLLFFCLFFSGVQTLYAEGAPQYNRRVLILNFVNQQKDTNADYLSVTIAEALIDPLKQTGKFEILPRSDAATFDEAVAIAKSIEVQADVVIVGNFVAIQNVVQIQAKAIDVGEKRLVLSKARTTRLNATIFDNINALAADMTKEMMAKLPPLTQREIVRDSADVFVVRAPVFHAYGSGGFIWGNERQYVAQGFAGGVDASFQLLHHFLQPYFSAGALFATGVDRVTTMTLFGADGGLSYGIPLPAFGTPPLNKGRGWGSIRPVIGGGFQMGSIKASYEIKYFVPAVFGGIIVDFFIFEKVSVAFAAKQYILAESDTPLKFLSLQIGVGVRL